MSAVEMTTAELSAALAQLQEGQALIVNTIVLTRRNGSLLVSPYGAGGDWERNECLVALLGLDAELTNAAPPPGVAANENLEPGLFFTRGDLGRWLRACGEGGRLVVEAGGRLMNDPDEDWLDDDEASWTRDRSRHFEERSFRAFPEVKVHGWRSNDGRMRLSVEGPSADRVLDGVTILEAEALREALDKALEHAKKRGAL